MNSYVQQFNPAITQQMAIVVFNTSGATFSTYTGQSYGSLDATTINARINRKDDSQRSGYYTA